MSMELTFSIRDAMQAAEQKTAIEGWTAFAWERVDGGCVVTGCIPAGVWRSGPRKGRPRCDHALARERRRVVVSDAELRVQAAAYEAETHRCWNCRGRGDVHSGWNAQSGPRYRTCSRCGGEGASPATLV